ncbi:MAG TPA: hypothetical protein VFN74_18895, partial [Chloroflexota bacterium]|nr:hypothetical protein [Chloroflexota bacterium]
RINTTLVGGHFRSRRHVWREPIYRNVWRLLRGFSDAELAAMIAPRRLIVDASPGPTVDGPPPPREGRRATAAPGTLTPAPIEDVRAEVARARRTYAALGVPDQLILVEPPGDVPFGGLAELMTVLNLTPAATAPTSLPHPLPASTTRHKHQFDQMVRYTQGLLRDSARQRDRLWAAADTSSLDAWQTTCQPYRRQLWDQVIGRLPDPTLPPNPRTRLAYQRPAWTGYEVSLDLFPDVFAYGILLLPNDLQPGEQRPVVVCQHGLEGRPQDLIVKEGRPYHQYAARLADRGYVVYAPQNPYIGRDDFRWLQRKANPLGWSLFSFIVAQHARTLEWLASLPYVDPARIAFYGLSYGGKTAMRVPALLDGRDGTPGYCLSICSGDFNEWIAKCASTDLPMSYLFTPEWEMFEFDLGHTFNYAEMAYLIAPRPFMVERGHRDGVALDEWVAFEYAKVQRRYADLQLSDHTEIAYFDGPHEIDARATFPFLDRHLNVLHPGTRP